MGDGITQGIHGKIVKKAKNGVFKARLTRHWAGVYEAR
jgi:hypothetical protein